MDRSQIPFFRSERNLEIGEITDFIDNEENSLAGPGAISISVETALKEYLSTERVFTTPSGTAAIEMAAILLDIGVGDEVIMPSWTFASTANAFIMRGAVIVFADIEPYTLNIDPDKVELAITARTRCIVTINYAGLPGNLSKLREIANLHKIYLFEDNAHGLGGSIDNRALGTFGIMAALSFHQTKNLQCGEGGALVLNDSEHAARAEIVREKGTNRSQFFRGEVDKYTWQDIGSSYVMSEILAKYLHLNWRVFDRSQILRANIWDSYVDISVQLCNRFELLFPKTPENCTPAYHVYWLMFPSAKVTSNFIRHFQENSIGVSRHYVPLHDSPAAKKYGTYTAGSMTNTIAAGETLVRLPLYSRLSNFETERILEALDTFKP